MSKQLGIKIKELRKQKGYTLQRLAELSGSTKGYIWQIENSLASPSAEKIFKIAEKLGVTIENLVNPETVITIDGAVDTQFYRKYEGMAPHKKKWIRAMADLLEAP